MIPRIPHTTHPIITLTTDFGIGDGYVAAMKGIILGINPDATIVDISHSIEPQNIQQGAFVLSTVHPYFPLDTIHVAIVDPGVGGPRRAIILETDNAIFLAPDNGILSYVAQASTKKRLPKTTNFRLPPELQAFEINNPQYWHHPVSQTFHGRDIFAPVAAHISLGVPLSALGQPITTINTFPISRPRPSRGGNVLVGHILHIDRFGNLVTDITSRDLFPGEFHIEISGHKITALSQSYEQSQGLLAIIGSSGRLEIAVRCGNAAELLSAKTGDELLLVRQPSRDSKKNSRRHR